ncbi:hypothetical protein [Holdemania sp. Marseille-P2844]|uniref:hypothetical protein n=1 Tax=Holdemania sp. Marseille-P2844 TaxID=1852366 RepID=UPI00093231C1|nr:hypothetical protein [Holdemania sp. Marseille-P2844]
MKREWNEILLKQENKLYIQFAQEIGSAETENVKLENYWIFGIIIPNYVLRTDIFSGGNVEKIKAMPIVDFLLSHEF